MAKKKRTTRRAGEDWQTESLRLTAFLRRPEDAPALGVWRDLVGNDPETSQARPRESAVIEAGPYEPGWLTLEGNPVRVDWRFSVNLQDKDALSELPFLGHFETVQRQFGTLMKRWLKKCPPLDRLAFGAILGLPVQGHVEGYRLLGSYLPKVEIDPKHSQDLLYQINRRRPSRSGIADLEINRLSKWSVSRMTTGIIGIFPSRARAQFMGTGETSTACRLELDISTAPEFETGLKKTMFSSLFDELVELGAEIALGGDIA